MSLQTVVSVWRKNRVQGSFALDASRVACVRRQMVLCSVRNEDAASVKQDVCPIQETVEGTSERRTSVGLGRITRGRDRMRPRTFP